MTRLTSKSLFGILVLGLMLLAGMSTDAMAQRRGRDRDRGWDRKCERFVNCHDGRDGRWDRRDRDRDFRFGNIFRRNRRDRDWDRDRDRWERRRRNRDRDWNDDRRWRRWR